MPSGSRKKTRTVTVVETPEKYEREIVRLQGIIDEKRKALRAYRGVEDIDEAIEMAKTELQDILLQRETAEKQAAAAMSSVTAKESRVKNALVELREARQLHEKAVRTHVERVATDEARLEVQTREFRAQEARAIEACERLAEHEEASKHMAKQAHELLCAAQEESGRAHRLIRGIGKRKMALSAARMAYERASAEHRANRALTAYALYRFRVKNDKLEAINADIEWRTKALSAEEATLQDRKRRFNEKELELHAALIKYGEDKREIDQRARRLEKVEREQGKREARLLGWEQRLKDKDRRLAVAASTVGKKVARDAEGRTE